MDNNKKYFDSPEFGRLLQRYERSLQMGKDEYFESDELSDIAEYYYDKKDKPRAEYVLDYAMHLHPGAVLPLVFKARIALIDEKNIEKARYYTSLISDEYDIDCLYLKAEIMIAEDKPEEASSFLRNAMDNIDEDDVPDFVLDVATIFIDYGLADISAEWLAMSDEDDLQDYREIKARIAFAKGDYEQSEQLFEKLLDEDPYSGHGQPYQRLNNVERILHCHQPERRGGSAQQSQRPVLVGKLQRSAQILRTFPPALSRRRSRNDVYRQLSAQHRTDRESP